MPEPRGSRSDRQAYLLLGVALCSLVLVGWLKFYGLLLCLPIIFLTFLYLRNRPDEPETRALRSSISLSAEDINDVVREFGNFAGSPDTDAVADRTLHRPALLDQDCDHPSIEAFRFQLHSSQRFLGRLPARLTADLSVAELESLLHVTDRRAEELKESWLLARRAAKQLGTGY